MSGIVAKFGGSSVKDAQAMRACANVVEKTPDLLMVVISATYNTTNQLEEIARESLTNTTRALELLEQNYRRHQQLAQDLGIWPVSVAMMEEIYHDARSAIELLHQKSRVSMAIDPQTMDSLYAIGERVSSLLFYGHLRDRFPQMEIHLADAREIIATDSSFGGAKALPEKIAAKIKTKWSEVLRRPHTLIVTQGFIGADDQGRTTILGREGSDYTATLLGEAIAAREVHIWTDVPGVAIADPKLFPNAPYIPEMSFEQAATMAQLGSKVLFSNTLAPSMRTGTPVLVGQTAHPEKGGTWIGRGQVSDWPLTLSMMESLKLLPTRFPALAPDSIAISVVGGERAERMLVFKALEQLPGVTLLEDGKQHLTVALARTDKGRAVVALLPFFDRATRLA